LRVVGGKKSKIEIDSSIWREEIQNRNRLLDLAGRIEKSGKTPWPSNATKQQGRYKLLQQRLSGTNSWS
jgi:hypothetical protein